MSPVQFYQKHLDRVSRSFAFCIAKLDGPMRSWVSLSYLVCRILDTVEDAPWLKSSQQLEQFERFDRLIESPKLEPSQILGWEESFPEDIPSGEKALIHDTSRIFSDLHSFPSKVQGAILEMVSSMSAGMRYFSLKKQSGQLKLQNLSEVNQYCFFVAGVVGEVLTRLVEIEGAGEDKPKLVDAYHFGLFLQKVNLLKDQRQDELEGRFFVPSRDQVYSSLSVNAHHAFAYLESLPLERRNFRLFCAWSMFLGLGSLPYIQESFAKQKNLKISRLKARSIVNQVESCIDQPDKLRQLFVEYSMANNFAPMQDEAIAEASSMPEWFLNLYKGKLSQAELLRLGLTA